MFALFTDVVTLTTSYWRLKSFLLPCTCVPLEALSTHWLGVCSVAQFLKFKANNTHNVSGSKDPVHYGTTKSCNHAKADKHDRSHQLREGTKSTCLLACCCCCFWRLVNPPETASQSRTLVCHWWGMLFFFFKSCRMSGHGSRQGGREGATEAICFNKFPG